MVKKTFIIIFCTLFIAVVALFAATPVMAQQCSNSTTITVPKGTITMTAVDRDGQPITDGSFPWPSTNDDPNFPCPDGNKNCNVSVYTLTDNTGSLAAVKSVAQWFACYPVCCGDEFLDLYGLQSDHIFYPGDAKHVWPVKTCYTAWVTPSASTNRYNLIVYTSPIGNSRVMDLKVKVGSKNFDADSGIIGADCGKELFGFYQALPSTNEISVGFIKKRYSRKLDGCVYKVEFYNDPANCGGNSMCSEVTPGWVEAVEFSTDPIIWTEKLVGAGSTKGDSDVCGDYRFTVAGSPGWDCDYVAAKNKVVCSCIGTKVVVGTSVYCCDPSGTCKEKP